MPFAGIRGSWPLRRPRGLPTRPPTGSPDSPPDCRATGQYPRSGIGRYAKALFGLQGGGRRGPAGKGFGGIAGRKIIKKSPYFYIHFYIHRLYFSHGDRDDTDLPEIANHDRKHDESTRQSTGTARRRYPRRHAEPGSTPEPPKIPSFHIANIDRPVGLGYTDHQDVTRGPVRSHCGTGRDSLRSPGKPSAASVRLDLDGR